jgi:hypothetical protein
MFIAFTIMANAYWRDAERWADKFEATPTNWCRRNIRMADWAFRLCALLMSATMAITVVPLYLPAYSYICKWLLLPIFFVFLVFVIVYLTGRYLVPLGRYAEDEEKKRRSLWKIGGWFVK